MRSKSSQSFFRKSRFVNTLAIGYLFLAIVVVVLEFFNDKELLFLVKPLVIPTLLFLYWCSTRRINLLLVLAMIAAWIVNLMSSSSVLLLVVLSTLFSLVYKVIYVHLVHTSIKVKTAFPMLVGSVPFLLFYVLLTIIAYRSIDDMLSYLAQCVLLLVFGAYALANFFTKSRKSSLYLLLAVVFLMIDQVLRFILRGSFEAVGMLFFYAAHYLFCRFLVLDEKRRRHHDSFKIQISPRQS